MPSWLLRSGPVFLKKHVRRSKHDDIVEEVDLLDANPMFAKVRHKDGREQNVSLCDLAPCPEIETAKEELAPRDTSGICESDERSINNAEGGVGTPAPQTSETGNEHASDDRGKAEPRRSTRSTRGVPPERYGQPVYF